ncbi:type II toxin-antitoxin system VapB family antitoxin [Nocardioides euryhalodurans]|uniref:Antitoxin n=1 Tax=Nocardioides euryhalodurans TaxID=2518370 RepID=A0A4P7GJV2_9ACTN|nr:type II toxin-antitoxin system VapB family antitoxin [Nocardioides euryhalodurans]QBR92265.1 hypothetical protein EXE57_08165 [Nocardioides euryhalodurans]
MAFTVKSERVQQLAREAARVTGKSQVGAIEEALERLLREYGADPQAARTASTIAAVRRLVEAYGADAGDPDREIRAVDDLYDEQGLPR